jgi:hypothetical protein
MIQYETIQLTVAAGATGESKILSGLAGLTRRVHLLGADANAAAVYVTARVNQTQTIRYPSAMNMGTGYWVPVEQDITPNDELYVGYDNTTGAQITQNIAIAYEDLPATGG